jgi:hypothetical protein
MEAKEESIQKGFDDGFQESFTNHCTLNRLKGITLALLMADAETENEARRLSLENVFQVLEDIELVLSDYERIATSGGPLQMITTFDHLKSQLLSLVSSRTGEQSELAVQISECPSLTFSSFDRVTSNSLDTATTSVPSPKPPATIRERTDELSF